MAGLDCGCKFQRECFFPLIQCQVLRQVSFFWLLILCTPWGSQIYAEAGRFIFMSPTSHGLQAVFLFFHALTAIKTKFTDTHAQKHCGTHSSSNTMNALIPGFWLPFHFQALRICLTFLPAHQCIWKDAFFTRVIGYF